MSIFNSIVAALKPLATDDVQLTLAGKEGHGNQNVRVHYKRDNLLSKVLYRGDLSALGADSEIVAQYLAGLTAPQQSPWTSLPGKAQVQLTAILRAANIDADMFLKESNDVAQAVLGEYEKFERTHAFVRQWQAAGKGIGLEVIVVFKSDDEFAIFESSLNFYIEPDASKLIRILRERKEAEEKANVKTADVKVVADGVETTV
jgi:hypothetical protein